MSVASPDREYGCTFRTRGRDNHWIVTKDNVFYGEYLAKAQAVRSACLAAQGVEAAGGRARVLALPGDAVIPHRGYSFVR